MAFLVDQQVAGDPVAEDQSKDSSDNKGNGDLKNINYFKMMFFWFSDVLYSQHTNYFIMFKTDLLLKKSLKDKARIGKG